MYVTFKNTVCITAKWLYTEGELITYNNYKYHKKVKNIYPPQGYRACKGRPALVVFDSLLPAWKEKAIEILGDPHEQERNYHFTKFLENDSEAQQYYDNYLDAKNESLKPTEIKKYVAQASVLKAMNIVIEKTKDVSGSTKNLWLRLPTVIHQVPKNDYPHALPKSEKGLKRKLSEFNKFGYEYLVHGGKGNNNRSKINGKVAKWWLAYYGLPMKYSVPFIMEKYNQIRKKKGFPEMSEQAVNFFLSKPENERKWIITRHGKEAYEKKFGYHVNRDKSRQFPNAWWAIDGTKLDWVHFEDNHIKMAAKLKINVLMDVYSEKILGYTVSQSESHQEHFITLKAAANQAQVRPYLITYDNQSGHKSQKMQGVYDSVVAKSGGVHYAHKAYRKSNPIEQMFNRLQQQVIGRFWFADKQTIKARKDDNKPNMDFVIKNKDNLLAKEQLVSAFEICVKLWNEAKHPRLSHMSRNQAYAQEMPMKERFDFEQQVNAFWINYSKLPVTYKRGGINPKIRGTEYWYEVYDDKNEIDTEFRRINIGKKFYINYDPEYLNDFVRLYKKVDGELVFVANAQPKRTYEQVPALMKEGEREQWKKDFQIGEIEYNRDLFEMNEIFQETGITPEKIIEEQEILIKMGGKLPKTQRNEVEGNSLLDQL